MSALLSGCNGLAALTGRDPQGSVAAVTSGRLTLHVTLPQQVQALVSNTQSVKVLLRNPGLIGPDRTAIANGTGPQTITLSALPPGGGYTLYVGAYSGTNATGTLMTWGNMPLSIQSGVNNANLGLSVRVAAGSSLDDLINGPAGSSAQVASTQWVQTTMADFTPGTTNNTELFVPGIGTTIGTYLSAGANSAQLNNPTAMALDRTGDLYVVERYNHRVEKFDSNLNFLRGWGEGTIWTGAAPATASGNANGWFNQPLGIAIDAQNNVYVTDNVNGRVQKFDSSGNFIMGWGNGTTWTGAAPAPATGTGNGYFQVPNQMAVDANNNVYVSDLLNRRINVFSSSGSFLRGIGNGTTWNASSPAPTPVASNSAGYFNEPQQVAIDALGTLYVADWQNARVQAFSANGMYLRQWGGTANVDGQFPYDVISLGIDPFGRIWVGNGSTTAGSNYLQLFTPGGQYLSRLVGPTANQLLYNRSSIYDAAGNLYTSDDNSGVISKFKGASPTDPNGGIRLAGFRTVSPSNFVTSGTYVSPVLDAQSTVNWGSVYWVVSNLPASTGVAMAVATSSDDVTWSGYQSVAGSSLVGVNSVSLAASQYQSRFLRYQLTLSSSAAANTPEVQEAGVLY